MEGKGITIRKLSAEYPKLKNATIPKINRDIFHHLLLFSENKNLLLAALIQNPLGKTSGFPEIKKNFGSQTALIIERVNHLQAKSYAPFKNYSEWKSEIMLFLINYRLFFERYAKAAEAARMFAQDKIKYAQKLLENMDITEIRSRLEDRFFAIAQPNIFNNYQSLLKFTKKKFLTQQRKITRDFEKILENGDIEATIESRLKSIWSIHNKITKKNILFSQVLDTIGLRIIVESEEDCYRAMVLILKKSPIITSLVKDYIAIPKENGYQSIHLTILHEGHPVEIQIRTFEMHRKAQYGEASHLEYKKNGTK